MKYSSSPRTNPRLPKCTPARTRKGPAVSLAVTLAVTSAVALLGCNNNPRINASGGGGTGAGKGGAGGTGSTTDAGTGVILPEVGGTGSGGSGGGASDGGGSAVDERQCGLDTFTLKRLPPDLMLVLDRSSSMSDNARITTNPMATLWSETVGALDEVIKATHMGVNWGLQMFPQPSGCAVAPMPEVAVAVNNYDMVMNTSKAAGPAMASGLGGGTPTGAAMDGAVAYLRTLTTNNPKYIVLATDGLPTCPTGAGADAPGVAVTAVGAAAAAGFKTYVIGIAIGVAAQTTLNRLAVAGGVPRNDPLTQFYPVSSKTDLVTALTAITGQVTNCVFPLTKPPPVPTNVKVTVAGAKVEPDATNGWSYTAGNAAIQFNGTACEQVKNMPGDVQIVFGCPNEIIP
jgi:hypothetical protein